MKRLVIAGLLACPFSIFGATRSVYDLMYLPTQGSVFGFSTLNAGRGKIEESSTKTDLRSYTFRQTLGYSITDRFSLSASMDWQHSSSSLSNTPKVISEGLSDPSLSAKIRLLEDKWILDFIGDYSFGLEDQTKSMGGLHYNNKNGGSVARGAFQLGQKEEGFQWSVLARYTRAFEATTDVTYGANYKSKAYNSALLEANFLGQTGAKSFIRSFVNWSYTDPVNRTAGQSRITSSRALNFGGEYQHLVSENLLLRAGLNYIIYKKSEVQQYDTWNFLVGANYQF